MRKEIRQYFIDNFVKVTESTSVIEAEQRSERYDRLLSYYIKLADKNECGCFNKASDILLEIDKHKLENLEFIQNGREL